MSTRSGSMSTTPAAFWGLTLDARMVVDGDPRRDASALLRAHPEH